VGAEVAEAVPRHGLGQGVPAWDSTLDAHQSSTLQIWPNERMIGCSSESDLDPTASLLFAREKKQRSKPTAIKSQTPFPPIAGHHGHRRRGGEEPAVGAGGRSKDGQHRG
jgi:hypothetical protein